MATPIIEKFQREVGRVGEATFRASWQTGQTGDIENEVVVDLDSISHNYTYPALTVLGVEWTKGLNLEARLEFNSMPPKPESTILSLPSGELAGKTDFCHSLNGGWPDPNRPTGGDIVVTTDGALQNDDLFIRLRYRLKGTSNPG